MIYCKTCLYPDTKPDLFFDEQGICSACNAYNNRPNINWEFRRLQFEHLCHTLKLKDLQYHCVIPVSGGKDSTYQVIKAKEYGLNPLAVCAVTDDLSAIGRHNLDNICKLGVDLIEVNVNSRIRRKINKYTLEEIGDISWAEHVTIFTIPIRMAWLFGIPYVFYGENPQNEYGGPEGSQRAIQLDNRWLQEYGGLNGLRLSDIVDKGLATTQELNLYLYPDLSKTPDIKAIWIGQYFPWDGLENAIIATKNGFKTWYGPVEGVGYDYENLDNHQTGIHDRFKYLKFGFGRATDLVNNHIKRGRITREQGKDIVLRFDGAFPRSYLQKPLGDILDRIGMSIDQYINVENKFANPELFEIRQGKPPRAKFKDQLRNA